MHWASWMAGHVGARGVEVEDRRTSAHGPSRRIGRHRVDGAAALLRSGVADPDGRGLLMRGWEPAAIVAADLAPGSALGVAAEGLLRLARLAEQAAARLSEHPDAEVRLSAAMLAAAAHPLIEGLDAQRVP